MKVINQDLRDDILNVVRNQVEQAYNELHFCIENLDEQIENLIDDYASDAELHTAVEESIDFYDNIEKCVGYMKDIEEALEEDWMYLEDEGNIPNKARKVREMLETLVR